MKSEALQIFVLSAFALLLSLGIQDHSFAQGWYNSSWRYRKAITVNASQVPSSQSNFPMLVSLASDAGLAAKALDNGYDITFTRSDGTTLLPYQRESFDGTSGALVAWVNVNSISNGTVIYMYYGNPGQSTDLQQAASTWDANYVGVYHIDEPGTGAAGEYIDSKTGNNGTIQKTAAFLRAQFNMTGSPPGNNYRYDDLSAVGDYTIANGDVLIYNVWWTSSTDFIAFDFTCTDGSILRGNASDQNGIGAHPAADLSSHALNQWYQRIISIPASFNGKIISFYDIACEYDGAGTKTAYIDYIYIINGATVKAIIRWPTQGITITNHLNNPTSNTISFTNVADPGLSAASGKIVNSLYGDQLRYINMGTSATSLVNNWTLEAWVYLYSTSQSGLMVYNGNDAGGFGIGISDGSGNAGGKLTGLFGSAAWVPSNYTFPSTGLWTHVVFKRESGTANFYVNGTAYSATSGGTVTPNTPAAKLTIGNELDASNTPYRYFAGQTDEVRISNVARSADWILTEYRNQNSPSTFYTVATEETNYYVWNKTGTDSWSTAANWTPNRAASAVWDILVFNGGGSVTVTNVPAQTIEQLLLTNSSTVNLQAAAGGNTLTVNSVLTTNAGDVLNFGSGVLLGGAITTLTNNGKIQTAVLTATSITPIPTGRTWGGTVEYNGSGSQTAVAGTYTTLKINNSVGVTLGGASTVTTLTIGDVTSNSIFSDNGNQITSTGTINLTSGTFKIGGVAATIFPNFGAGINISAGTTVEYAAGVAQAVRVTPAYANLTFSGAGAKTPNAGTVSVGGHWSVTGGAADLSTNNSNVTVAGNITGTGPITSGTTSNIILGGNWTNSGTFTKSTGTVTYNGTSVQSVAALSYNNLTLSGAGQKNTSGSTVAVGAVLNNSSMFDMAGYTLTLGTSTTNTGTVRFSGTSNGLAIGTGTVEYYGATQTVATGTYSTLNITVAGTKTAGGAITATTLDNGGPSNVAAVLDMAGNTLTATTIDNTGATINFSGASNGLSIGTGTVEYNGTTQIVATGTYSTLNITAAGTKTAGGAITATTLDNGGASNVAAVLDMGGNTLTATTVDNTGATIKFSGASNGKAIPTGTIEYSATGGSQIIAAGTYNNLTMDNTTGTNSAGGIITVGGAFTSNGGTTFNSAYNINFNGTTTCGTTMNATAGTVTYGSSAVNILAGTYSGLSINGSPVTYCGVVTVNGTFAPTGTINTSTSFTISGSVTCGGSASMNATAGTVEYTATGGSQNIIPGTYYNLKQDNTSGTNTACGNLTINGTLTTSSGGTLDMSTYTLGGTLSTIINNGTIVTECNSSPPFPNGKTWGGTGIVNYNGGTISGPGQIVAGGNFYFIQTILAGNYTAGADITVSNTFDNGGGSNVAAVLDMLSFNLNVSVTFGNSGATTKFGGASNGHPSTGGGLIVYDGSNQTIGTSFNGGVYAGDLTIAETSGDATLGGDVTVNGTLTLTSGRLTLGAYNLTLGSAAVAGTLNASNMIVATGSGECRRSYTANGSYTFPVGDATGTAEYSPVTLNFISGSYSSAYAGVRVINAKHPNNASTTNYLNRYWTVTSSGITSFSCNVAGTYVSADVAGTEASQVAGEYSGSLPWIKYSTLGSNTLTANAVTGFGDFTGITGAAPTATITADPSSSICKDLSLTLTANPVGDATFTYLWSPGGAATQAINPSTATPGSTPYTVTATDGNGFTATNSVTVTVIDRQKISGTFYYNNSSGDILLIGQDITVKLYKTSDLTHSDKLDEKVTNASGYYEFTDLCPALNYDIVSTSTHTTAGSVNTTDAAQDNFWGVSPGSIEKVRFYAGDVTGAPPFFINSGDAHLIQAHFVNGTPFDKGTWNFWRVGETISDQSSPPAVSYPTVTLSVGSNLTADMYGLCAGDFNRSFDPRLTKSASSTLFLIYSADRQVSNNKEFDLPLHIVNASEVGAVSLILNFPADLVEIKDVVMKGAGGQLDWAVKGNELRIGWHSMNPLRFEANDELLTLKFKSTDAFTKGNSVRLSLAQNPLNELADDQYNVIGDAVLSVDVIDAAPVGIEEQPPVNGLTLSNHPNPFNSYTIFEYTLPFDGKVTLEIHNLLGVTEKILVNEMQASGDHTLKFDAGSLPSGIYTATIRLRSNSDMQVRTIKLVNNR